MINSFAAGVMTLRNCLRVEQERARKKKEIKAIDSPQAKQMRKIIFKCMN